VGIEQGRLPGCEAAVLSEAEGEGRLKFEARFGKPRYEVIDREQLCWRPIDIERLIGGCMGTAKEWDQRERSKSYANGSRRISG
jgi:hypothetical protein